ncbi:sialate O-acetylesterase [Flammeovirga aprica]|uniref:Sialate O-acetylesterase n=1 Tax=Flammeovirga aprica JL-4 TaxID=694437 RepID=A0A7X9XBM3_9BACT|nr:sialate O-acetylesterase [Flammeovirga aprica]NME70769.1 sialate O-acetylesterase [Flammeovirga aprica JL-4]
MKKLFILALLWVIINPLYALSVSNLFSSNMVLQQNTFVTIWGWGKTGETIKVHPSWGDELSTTVDQNSNWKVRIKTPPGGYRSYDISIQSDTESIELRNVVMGEVWLAVGQTNITSTFEEYVHKPKEVFERASYPNIRMMTVHPKEKGYVHEDISGNWELCSQAVLDKWSELGYYFALNITEKLNVPIGVVVQDWGDEPIDSWHEEEILEQELANQDKDHPEAQPFTFHQYDIHHHALMYQYRDYKFTGILWSHGKDQPNKKGDYKKQMNTLIHHMRQQFGKIPFYYVQIAPYKYKKMTHGAVVRDHQRQLLHIDKTAMVVTSDISDIHDLHSKNKDEIGIRLAKIALKKHYRVMENELVESPQLTKVVKEGKKLFVYYEHSKGLHFEDGDQGDFEVSGEDHEFHIVKAKVHRGVVVLELGKIKKPKFVRFGWNSRAVPLLVNDSGLPASCFSKQEILNKNNKAL